MKNSIELGIDFQLTTSRRGRPNADCLLPPLFTFNSRPHAEVDFQARIDAEDRKSFNSRPHAEVDAVIPDHADLVNLSTHDLTQRSTENAHFFCVLYTTFNSRPHAEVDCSPSLTACWIWTFNSRPHAEVDVRVRQLVRILGKLSTHDLTQRSTRLPFPAYVVQHSFNSRPHAEVDAFTEKAPT